MGGESGDALSHGYAETSTRSHEISKQTPTCHMNWILCEDGKVTCKMTIFSNTAKILNAHNSSYCVTTAVAE